MYVLVISLAVLLFMLVTANIKSYRSKSINLNSLTEVQIRYKLNTGHSICIRDRVRNLYMLIYPIDFKSARILIPRININRIHKCEISLLSEVMELIECNKVDVYDGEAFMTSI